MLANGNIKHCPKCDQDKPLDAFANSKSAPDGLTTYCKECRNRAQREKYHSDPELRKHKAEAQRELYTDPAKHEEQLARQRAWYQEHYADPEYVESERARGRAYSATDRGKEVGLAQNRKRRAEHREEVNRKHREYARERYNNDPEYKQHLAEWFRRRRNMKRSNGGTYELDEWQMLVAMTKGKCLCCGKKRKLELDHVKPVSKGGTSNLDNLQPLCRSCNAGKGATTADYRTPAMLQMIDILS